MVNKAKEVASYQHIYPNSTMASEWDVLAEIRTAMRELSQTEQPTMDHIKGHQDRDTPYDDLPLRAQLNCDADGLADEYYRDDMIVPNFQNVPIMPTSGCQLNLAKGTITHDIKIQLNLARSVPPLQTMMCAKHGWSEDIFHDIDWTAHGKP